MVCLNGSHQPIELLIAHFQWEVQAKKAPDTPKTIPLAKNDQILRPQLLRSLVPKIQKVWRDQKSGVQKDHLAPETSMTKSKFIGEEKGQEWFPTWCLT